MTRLMILLAALAFSLAITAPDSAAMSLGMQDDAAMTYQDPATYLARVDGVKAGWLRLSVTAGHWRGGQADAYVAAAAAARADGKKVFVSLLSWRDYPTPAEWRAYAEQVVARMAPYVDAWSVMNEPNWPGMSAATATKCVIGPVTTTTPMTTRVRRGVRIEHRFHHVRPGRGRWLRRVTHRRHHRHVHFTRAHGKQRRHAAWRRTTRRVKLYRRNIVYNSTTSDQETCSAEVYGVAYRKLWDAVAPVLAATGGKLIVGDLCPCGDNRAFMDAFYSTGEPAVRPDVLGVHPYFHDNPTTAVNTAADWRVPNTDDAVAYASRHGMDAWATEWAATPGDPTFWWPAALTRMAANGIKVTMIYDTPAPPGVVAWDTQMRSDALAAVTAWNAMS